MLRCLIKIMNLPVCVFLSGASGTPISLGFCNHWTPWNTSSLKSAKPLVLTFLIQCILDDQEIFSHDGHIHVRSIYSFKKYSNNNHLLYLNKITVHQNQKTRNSLSHVLAIVLFGEEERT